VKSIVVTPFRLLVAWIDVARLELFEPADQPSLFGRYAQKDQGFFGAVDTQIAPAGVMALTLENGSHAARQPDIRGNLTHVAKSRRLE
jgi:hypothetical protein